MPVDPAKPFDLRFVVSPAFDRARLDHFIKAMMPSMSRTRVQLRIGEGRIEVNGTVRLSNNWRVLLGDEVLIRCNIPQEGEDAGKYISLDIIYEDDDILVLNKQAGLVVHPVGKHRHDTLLNALYWRYKDVLPPECEIGLANRLDQHTSGVILVTKHVAAKRVIQEDFERRMPRKAYLALCHGLLEPDEGEIDLPIGPEGLEADHCRMTIRHDESGKPAQTRYRVERRFAAGFSLVRLHPITGRQHQLRVHLSAIGHPLVADARYGGQPLEVSPMGKAPVRLDRYALHAESLEFNHPVTGQAMRMEASLAEDLAAAVDALATVR